MTRVRDIWIVEFVMIEFMTTRVYDTPSTSSAQTHAHTLSFAHQPLTKYQNTFQINHTRKKNKVTYGTSTKYHVYQFYSPTFLIFEVSTLFVNMRWVLVELGLKTSKLYIYNGLSLLLAWFLFRIVWGFASSYQFWVDTVRGYNTGVLPAPIVLWYTLSNISLNALNVMWFGKIIKGAIKTLSASSRTLSAPGGISESQLVHPVRLHSKSSSELTFQKFSSEVLPFAERVGEEAVGVRTMKALTVFS